MSELTKILKDFGAKLKVDIQTNLENKMKAKAASYGTKFNSSSRLKNSIKFFVTENEQGTSVSISMNDYGGAVDGGRIAAGVSEDGQKSIEEWSKTKGVAENYRVKDLKKRKELQSISKANNPTHKYKTLKKMPFDRAATTMAYLVSRKLKEKGYEGNNFYTEVINDGRIDDLTEYIANTLGKQVIIELKGFK